MIKRLCSLFSWRPGTLARQGGAVLGWMLLRAFAQAATIVLLARALSGHTYGEFVAVIAVASFSAPLAGLGLAHMVLRNVARDPLAAPWYLRRAFIVWVWTLAPIAGATVYLAFLLLPQGLPIIAVGVAVTSELLAASLTDLAARYRQAQHRPHSYGAINTGLPMIRLLILGVLVTVVDSVDIATLLWAYAAANLGYVALLWPIVRPTPINAADTATEAMPLTSGLPFSASALAMRLQGEFNKPILAHTSFGLAGTYNIAQRAVDMASLPLLALQEALWPRLYAQKDPLQQLRRTGVALMTMSLIMGLTIWHAAPLLTLLVDQNYSGAAELTKYLAMLPSLLLIRNLVACYAVHRGWMHNIGITSIIGGVFNIIMVSVLVPEYGLKGAVIASYGTEACMIFTLIMLPIITRKFQT